MEPYTALPGDKWRLGRGPFIFSGVPPVCTGEIELFNDSEEKLKVRTIPAIGHDDERAVAFGLGEVRLGAQLPPQGHTYARARFVLDVRTPPGTYIADLVCGEQRERVVVHVFEKLNLWVEPDAIQLRGSGGDLLTALIVIRNRGNVTETLTGRAQVFLEERNWAGRSMVYALRDTKGDEGHQAYLDRLVTEMRATIARPAQLTVHGAVSEVQPGMTQEVRLEITLPKELIKGRTYIGSAPFMSSELFFEVECNGSVNSTKRRPR